VLNSDDTITVHLRDAEVVRTVRSEVILDVNHHRQWFRGIELIGGVDFDLFKAVKPFMPVRPLSEHRDCVSYDGEANAAFIYLRMKPSPATSKRGIQYSHSITPEAEFSFDAAGGLVWLRFSARDADATPIEFVSLVDAPIERASA